LAGIISDSHDAFLHLLRLDTLCPQWQAQQTSDILMNQIGLLRNASARKQLFFQ